MSQRLVLAIFLLSCVAATPEDITLKDGSKITGKIVGVNDKVFEVDSTYGHLAVPRQEIVSIIFTENEPKEPEPAQKSPRKVEDEVQGTQYINHSAGFTLTLPKGWDKKPEIRSNEIVGAVGDQLHYIVVLQEHFEGSLETYKQVVELQKPTALTNYKKVDESSTTIDGRPAIVLSFTGTTESAKNLPMQFELAMIQYEGGQFVQIMGWSLQPLFATSRPTFEQVMHSYKQLPEKPALAAPKPR
jgi:hypothetical protein